MFNYNEFVAYQNERMREADEARLARQVGRSTPLWNFLLGQAVDGIRDRVAKFNSATQPQETLCCAPVCC